MRRWLGLGGVLVSLLALGFIIWRIDLKRVWDQLSRFGWFAWLVGACIYILAFIPRGWRWKLMLPASRQIGWVDVTKVVIVGYAANNILPFRLGEVVRSFIAGTRFKISKLTCLGTIAAEKALDGCCLLALLASTLPFVTVREEWRSVFRRLALVLALLFALSLAGCFALAKRDAWFLSHAKRRLPPVLFGLFQTGMGAVAAFKSGRTMAITMALTFCVWALEGLCFSFFLDRMGVEMPLPRGFFCLAVVNMSILVPSAPGYVGVFQAGAVGAMVALGLDASQGLALAIITHAAQFFPTTILGVAFAGTMGLSWRRLYHLRDE